LLDNSLLRLSSRLPIATSRHPVEYNQQKRSSDAARAGLEIRGRNSRAYYAAAPWHQQYSLVKEMGTLLLKEHETNQIWTRKKRPDRYHVDFLVLQLVAADLLETGVDLSHNRVLNCDDSTEVFVKIAYKRDHDTTRSVDIATNWNELFLVLIRNVSIIRNVYLIIQEIYNMLLEYYISSWRVRNPMTLLYMADIAIRGFAFPNCYTRDI
jgi:hypothetical protein